MYANSKQSPTSFQKQSGLLLIRHRGSLPSKSLASTAGPDLDEGHHDLDEHDGRGDDGAGAEEGEGREDVAEGDGGGRGGAAGRLVQRARQPLLEDLVHLEMGRQCGMLLKNYFKQ